MKTTAPNEWKQKKSHGNDISTINSKIGDNKKEVNDSRSRQTNERNNGLAILSSNFHFFFLRFIKHSGSCCFIISRSSGSLQWKWKRTIFDSLWLMDYAIVIIWWHRDPDVSYSVEWESSELRSFTFYWTQWKWKMRFYILKNGRNHTFDV